MFSTLDLSSGFHQIRVDNENVDEVFGFRAMGRLYVMETLSMGYKVSPGKFQGIMDKLFESHERADPFMDDVGVASKNMREHLESDLPRALAICSKYNILLKAAKCDLAKSETRVLGFQVKNSATKLSCEKRDKIKEMSFPVNKQGRSP